VTREGEVRSVLLLEPRGGDYAALLTFFREHDILGLAVREAGCLSGEVQVPVSGTGPVMVTALWESAEAYAGWRNHPVRGRFSGDMDRLALLQREEGRLQVLAVPARQREVRAEPR
jgi:hypothetical protein